MSILDDVYTLTGAEVGMLKYLVAEAAMAPDSMHAVRCRDMAFRLLDHCKWDERVAPSVQLTTCDCGCATDGQGLWVVCAEHTERARSLGWVDTYEVPNGD